MHRDEIYAGQILWMNHTKGSVINSELVRVVRVNQKNVKAEAENGIIWTVHPSFLSIADTVDVCSFEVQAPGEQLTLGAVVRFVTGSSQAERYAMYRDFVVIAYKSDGTWSIAPLGGDRGKHIKSVRSDVLVVQPVSVVE